MTQSVAFIRCTSINDAKSIKNELEHPVYKFIVAITRYGNFNNIRILQNLSTINNIKLNEKEYKLIKRFNKKYYG